MNEEYNPSDFKLTWNGIEIKQGFSYGRHLSFDNAEGDTLDKIPIKTVEEAKELHLDFTKLHKGSSDVEVVATGKGLDILAEIPVRTPNLCKYNDCGWCYYKGDGESNDDNGQCNKHMSCEVYDGKS